jgi:ABC-type phosphate/phosphonate transport system substrate-binding protein
MSNGRQSRHRGHAIGWPNLWKVATFLFAASVVLQFLTLKVCFCQEDNQRLLRVAFSSKMFSDVNEEDAKAAMKVWAQVLYKERGLPISSKITVVNSVGEAARLLKNKQIEAVAVTIPEYSELRSELPTRHVVVNAYGKDFRESYVLLVRHGKGIKRVKDLRGKSIVFFHNPRMSLASFWLAKIIGNEGGGHSRRFFGRETQANKLIRVVTPVYFGQIDACVVTLRGFKTMSELNPQLGRQLEVIAASPGVVPGGLFLREDISAALIKKTYALFDEIDATIAGKQAMIVFQGGKLLVQPISILEESLELLGPKRKLRGSTYTADRYGGASSGRRSGTRAK